ncbi:hypothetical protein Z969_09150 [Clostridium novyi A str. 4570]|uniref:DUF4007 domain-containing protein n=1 Tax=Clostridium novyi A str. 4570 TaxID=1444290 RepID=A0AA88ZQ98_CLONO|nr:DUF4007 family protein [Clostridium novyi]KGN00915.1 hypothetical protein Z969_09150 [Clostridium novyi A str. 4570]
MSNEKNKFKLKGHESFYIREGWLRKGIKNIQQDSLVFLNNPEQLGVGSNMAKSIRYWLQATGLTEERRVKGAKREQILTEDFGKIINEYDPYFEDIFTLWLLHYKIAKNKEFCTSWYLFFNEFKGEEFAKEDLIYNMKVLMNKLAMGKDFSEKSLIDDCQCILKTYSYENYNDKNPEENIMSIFNELHILEKKKNKNGIEYFSRKKPSINKLDKLVVYYVILDNIKNQDNSTSISSILEDSCNAGKIFNLDRNILNEYLDMLMNDGYISINRTAGLDKIYIKKGYKKEVLKAYYEELQE